LGCKGYFAPNFPKLARKKFVPQTFPLQISVDFDLPTVAIDKSKSDFYIRLLIDHSIGNKGVKTSVPEFSTNQNFWGALAPPAPTPLIQAVIFEVDRIAPFITFYRESSYKHQYNYLVFYTEINSCKIDLTSPLEHEAALSEGQIKPNVASE